ncbi:MAG TPA: hypothetical protein VHZ74_21750 [Bryobacteraceae bacterium]|jgi:hypothetical protein|nr:hypothetical protein [Bryobacteraceae bacterium]
MNMNYFVKATFAVAILGLCACSSEPAKTTEVKTDADAAKKAPAGPPEPVAAKTAFYEMYTPAHTWAADLLPISLKSGEVAGVKNADGKAGVWTAIFGSPSQHLARTYTYAVAEQLPDIAKGVKAESPEAWAGPTTAAMTFQTSDFTIDSDAAYKTAAGKATEWLKDPEHAAKSVSLSLGAATRFPAPVWYILFGDSKNGFVALVNATTGNIIAK